MGKHTRKYFTLQIEMEDAAFYDPRVEIARILRELADHIESGGRTPKELRDANGNTVGFAGARSRRVADLGWF